MNYKEKTVLVTGGAGSIGREIVKQLLKQGAYVTVIDHEETSLFELKQEYPEIMILLKDIKEVEGNIPFDIIIHAAALKHVPLGETNGLEYVKTNVLGTSKIIDFAIKNNCELLSISTDKAYKPKSVMGATKMIAERMVSAAGFTSVRFGNVLFTRGSIIPIFEKQISENKPLTVTHKDMTRFIMRIEDAVKLVLDSIGKGGTQILEMPKIKILDLAYAFNELNGRKKDNIEFIGLREGEQLWEALSEDNSSETGPFLTIEEIKDLLTKNMEEE